MYKRFILIPLLLSSSILFAKENLFITAESLVLLNVWNKKIIYARNPHEKLPPASTTKLMTAILVLKNSHPNKRVVISRIATSMPPSKIHIKEGEEYLTQDLLKAVLLSSSNDASVALAESIAGREEEFVRMMNEEARRIGAKNTNFRTSNGLPKKGQYSTAYDLALIVREAMKDRRIVEIMKLKFAEIHELTTSRCIKLKNHNKSLWNNFGHLLLGKTGYTKNAKHCFAGYIHYNRWKKVIVVILRSKRLWSDLEKLSLLPNS